MIKFLNIIKDNKLLYGLYKSIHSIKAKAIEKRIINQLGNIENYSEEKIAQLQSENLQVILEYAFNNTVYYHNLFKSYGAINKDKFVLNKIPVLTKDLVKSNLSDLLSKQYKVNSLVRKKTGGSTTGNPFVFYANTSAGIIDFGHQWYLYSLMGYKRNDLIVGCSGLAIEEKTRNRKIYWVNSNKNNVFGGIIFSSLYFNDNTIALYAEKLLSLKPAFLRGYPSFYASIAKFLDKNKIDVDFRIKGVKLTSEMCLPEQLSIIKKVYKAPVFFEYGHSEVCLYCYTKDETYEYHSSPIYGYIEVLNEDGSETKIGDIGKIIVTGFINRGMPFIRYDTGDKGEISYRNKGNVRFSRIIGRTQDYLVSLDHEKILGIALIVAIRKMSSNTFSLIDKWQIIQEKAGYITVLVKKNEGYSKTNEREMYEAITSELNLKVEFKYVNDVQKTKSGKSPYLIQRIK